MQFTGGLERINSVCSVYAAWRRPYGLRSERSSAASSLLNGSKSTRFVALPCIRSLGTQRGRYKRS
jgi:hypothetical protein